MAIDRIEPTGKFVRFEKVDVEQSIPDRFEKIAKAHEDRLAVATKRARLTYGDLNRQSNRIAHAVLEACGEGSSAVALLTGRGAEGLAAIMGVLKAGKFFVPLDPAQPSYRNRLMLEDSGATLVLNDGENAAGAESLAGGHWRILRVESACGSASTENLDLRIRPDDPAYVLYTSGSTGAPKGVLQSHRNVLNYVMRFTNPVRVCSSDRISFLLSITHSAAMMDFFGALLNGAALYPLDVREEGLARLASWLEEEELTVAHMVPTLFRHFASSLGDGRSFPRLRILKLSGEQVSVREVALFRTAFPQHTLLMNTYGATEINSVRHFFMSHATRIEGSVVPAGFETEDTEVKIVDDEGREVEANCIGEITIRSAYLSPGYWNRPELTAAAFLPDPMDPTRRVYKTGDVGYLTPEGCLFSLGRKDQQVKIRGHRIEPAEIETALLRNQALRECVVVARNGASGEKQLVAYVVPERDQVVDARRLRDSLRDLLPGYMIPAAFVELDRIPVTATGKTDRLALPAPDPGATIDSRVPAAPRDGIEKELLAIWERLLERRPIGVEDDFFDIGGDSLLAIQLLLELERRFGIEVPPSLLLRTTTISGLSEMVRGRDPAALFPCLVPIRTGGDLPPFFCLHELTGDVLHFRQMVSHISPDLPVYGLTSKGLESADLDSVEKMAGRYVEAIRGVQPRGPYFVGGFSAGGVWAFEVARQLDRAGERVGLLAMLDTAFPVDMRPLSRLGIARAMLRYEFTLLRAQPWREWIPFFLHKLRRACAMTIQRSKTVALGRISRNPDRAGTGEPATSPSWVDSRLREAYRHYTPPVCAVPITLFWATEGDVRPMFAVRDPRTGWQDVARGGIRIREVHGDHMSVLNEPHVQELARKVTGCLIGGQSSSATVI